LQLFLDSSDFWSYICIVVFKKLIFKTMKKLILTLGFAFIAVVGLQAQTAEKSDNKVDTRPVPVVTMQNPNDTKANSETAKSNEEGKKACCSDKASKSKKSAKKDCCKTGEAKSASTNKAACGDKAAADKAKCCDSKTASVDAAKKNCGDKAEGKDCCKSATKD
jgi:hypothetical protein